MEGFKRMAEITRVESFLKKNNYKREIIRFNEDTSTSELAAQALGTEVARIAKSIVFKNKSDDFFMVVAAGNVKINNKAIKELTGSKAKMANAEEVLTVTGFSPGGVCPFALVTDLPVYLDESLQSYELVYTAAGTSNAVLPISYGELLDITGGIGCRVTSEG